MRLIAFMPTLWLSLFLCFPAWSFQLPSEDDYINEWTQFYPSRALREGMHKAVFNYEERSADNIEQWINYNREVLTAIESAYNVTGEAKRINMRLMKMQIRKELQIWEGDQPHLNSPLLYVNLVNNAWESVWESDFLTSQDQAELVCSRLTSILHLIRAARENLEEASPREIEVAVSRLETAESYLTNELPLLLEKVGIAGVCNSFEEKLKMTVREIGELRIHISDALEINEMVENSILGKEKYASELVNYTDQQISPDELAAMAFEEIVKVRALILQVSREYLKETYPENEIPNDEKSIIRMAFNDMEKDVPLDGKDYLDFWEELAEAATLFVEEHQIATLPEFPTLRIINAPESAGPMARIGWVDSAPPFAPNPVTTLYLPSIPDTFPEQERIAFWSSFNKPFNRMIVIHELIPGHYMQIKVSRETPHPIRLWFPYGPYFEGWASFVEEVVLNAGWEAERPLTYLAHLRKRLENANRAYTSVMVHCEGWSKEEVLQFSTETSLLAPQFASSLWGRLMRSPMQMTSYFYGGKAFRDLWSSEKERLKDNFDLKLFMDTIMKAGPIPIDEFESILMHNGK